MKKRVLRKTFVDDDSDLESIFAKELIEELAYELETFGHPGKQICEWFVSEGIKRGRKDMFMDTAAYMRQRADELENQG